MKTTGQWVQLGVRIEDYSNPEDVQECFDSVRISTQKNNVPNDIVEKELRRAFELALENFLKKTK